ncbi:hypothetical protein THRCLA_05931 [Thraustotheca clavata]|uniref:Transmembrane protein n=1 Tax=Thraustotheca clavata TaxID=74557 RepID=A0A1V9ZRX0_9STRA|nr:hypothetical protein THRCLA_05931 [Thraustotheca clavata]
MENTRSMRRVLNTEKTFVTGKEEKQYVEVTMKVEGISFRLTQQQLAQRETKFDILLEKVVLGGVPVSAIKLIFVILTFLGLMLVFVYPKVNDLLHQPNAAKNV